MARFKLFWRARTPRLFALLRISPAERQVSRKHHLRIVHDPMSPARGAKRLAKRQRSYYSEPLKLVSFLRRLFR